MENCTTNNETVNRNANHILETVDRFPMHIRSLSLAVYFKNVSHNQMVGSRSLCTRRTMYAQSFSQVAIYIKIGVEPKMHCLLGFSGVRRSFNLDSVSNTIRGGVDAIAYCMQIRKASIVFSYFLNQYRMHGICLLYLALLFHSQYHNHHHRSKKKAETRFWVGLARNMFQKKLYYIFRLVTIYSLFIHGSYKKLFRHWRRAV